MLIMFMLTAHTRHMTRQFAECFALRPLAAQRQAAGWYGIALTLLPNRSPRSLELPSYAFATARTANRR